MSRLDKVYLVVPGTLCALAYVQVALSRLPMSLQADEVMQLVGSILRGGLGWDGETFWLQYYVRIFLHSYTTILYFSTIFILLYYYMTVLLYHYAIKSLYR